MDHFFAKLLIERSELMSFSAASFIPLAPLTLLFIDPSNPNFLRIALGYS